MLAHREGTESDVRQLLLAEGVCWHNVLHLVASIDIENDLTEAA